MLTATSPRPGEAGGRLDEAADVTGLPLPVERTGAMGDCPCFATVRVGGPKPARLCERKASLVTDDFWCCDVTRLNGIVPARLSGVRGAWPVMPIVSAGDLEPALLAGRNFVVWSAAARREGLPDCRGCAADMAVRLLEVWGSRSCDSRW